MDWNLLHRRAHLDRLLPVRLILNNVPGGVQVYAAKNDPREFIPQTQTTQPYPLFSYA